MVAEAAGQALAHPWSGVLTQRVSVDGEICHRDGGGVGQVRVPQRSKGKDHGTYPRIKYLVWPRLSAGQAGWPARGIGLPAEHEVRQLSG